MPEDHSPTFNKQDYEVVSRETLYQGFLSMARYHLRFKLYDGGWSNTIIRELMERKSAAGILLYDPTLDHVVLIEQFRPGSLDDPQSPWLIETVAGVLSPHENPPDVVIREAKEESGCEVLDLYPICEYFVSPGGSNEYFSLFCGRIDASDVGGVFGLKEEDEDIRTFTLPAEEAFTLLREGKIKTSPAIISLQWLQLNREWLRQLWQKK
jgi:ADP-ribose pyrophosphatase